MASALSTRSRPVGIQGRDDEAAQLRALVEQARGGYGATLVIAGEPGLGKTALLDHARAAATDFAVFGTCGVMSESEIPLAGLHSLLGNASRVLPSSVTKQIADYRGSHQRIDSFSLYTALHRLLTDASRQAPVLCWIDDAHLMDRESLEALAFVARRCESDPVLVLFATDYRPEGSSPANDLLSDLPRTRLKPLDEMASFRILVDRYAPGLPEDLADELVELSSGIPLALVELASSLTPEQLGGDEPPPAELPRDSRQREHLSRAFGQLSDDARRLVLLALADERLDRDTVLRAAETAGMNLRAMDEARAAGIVVLDGDTIRLPSELVRSTLYSQASLAEQVDAHSLLSDILDPEQDRLRAAWHRAATAKEPRAKLADELADAAVDASWSGDHIAASRALQRASALTPRLDVRALRLIAAGADAWLAGRPRRSRILLRQARPLANSPELRGLTDLLRGGIELRAGVPAVANQTLMNATEQLAETNRGLAMTSLMFAGEASCVAGDYAGYYAAARRAAELDRPDDPPAMRLMQDHFTGLAAMFQGDHEDAIPPLRRVVEIGRTVSDSASRVWASEAAFALGDSVSANELATKALTDPGGQQVDVLAPWALIYQSLSALMLDRYPSAEASSLEGLRMARAIGQHNCAVDHLTILALISALQGDRETALERLSAASDGVAMRGLGRPGAFSSWAFACVELVRGRPADALDRFRNMRAVSGHMNPAIEAMAAPHFVEAAVRCGQRDRAVRVLGVFDRWAKVTGSSIRLAMSHRCHALLAEDKNDAEEHFREAIRLHRRSDTTMELAKTELLYAYRLRRSRKPREARKLLSEAVKVFEQYRATHWVEQAQSELRAAGETVGHATSATLEELTPQQAHISQLVAEGATNREIAEQLFISQRTVDYHLRNIFAKLGVRSRVELSRMLH